MKWKTVSTIFLVVVLYLIIGATVFKALEQPQEISQRTTIVIQKQTFITQHACVNSSELDELIQVRTPDELGSISPYGEEKTWTPGWTSWSLRAWTAFPMSSFPPLPLPSYLLLLLLALSLPTLFYLFLLRCSFPCLRTDRGLLVIMETIAHRDVLVWESGRAFNLGRGPHLLRRLACGVTLLRWTFYTVYKLSPNSLGSSEYSFIKGLLLLWIPAKVSSLLHRKGKFMNKCSSVHLKQSGTILMVKLVLSIGTPPPDVSELYFSGMATFWL